MLNFLPKNYKTIIRLAFPIILANASAPLLGLADTAAIGQTGDAIDLGGVALATLVFSFVYWGFGFLRMGTTGFIAQARGAKDHREVLTVLYRSVLLGLSIGILLILLQTFILKLATVWMSASDEVIALVGEYFRIRIWGAPATLISYALLGGFIGLGKTKELLWVQLLLNGVNIGLNVLFVVGFQMGIKGIALGTVIAEYIALFFAWYLLRNRLEIRRPVQEIKQLWNVILERSKVVALFKVNGDIMIRTFALLAGFAWFADQGAQFGDSILAANHVLLQFVSLSAFFLDGYAYVMEMLSGKAIGKKNLKEFKFQLKDSTIIAGVTAFLLGFFFYALGPYFIPLLSQDGEVQAIAKGHLLFAGIYILFSFVAFQLDGVFIGATQSREMRNASIISLIFFVGASFFLTDCFGNRGLWISFIFYVIVRGISLGLYLPKLIRMKFPKLIN